jgi:MinD-like ATPase involved in chromosome partitioning or flagellar assembly
VDLPTYTNIWRIEKRLYKLYDFRLPAPLPISWIAVFAGITAPYVFVLAAIGLPFNHNLVWLYVVPPGVLTWLTTRPVLENKRLPELLVSQLRYLSEPRTWCRMAPLTEKDEIRIYVRVWHRAPARSEQAAAVPALAGRAAGESGLAPGLPAELGLRGGTEPARRPGSGRQAGPGRTERPRLMPQPVPSGPATWPHAGVAAAQGAEGARAGDSPAVKPAAARGAGGVAQARAGAAQAGAGAAGRPAIAGPSARTALPRGSGAQVSPGVPVTPPGGAGNPPVPPARPLPIEVSHEEEGHASVPLRIVPADPRIPAADGRPGAPDGRSGAAAGGERKPAPANTAPSHPVPSIERALSGPAKDRIDGWRRRVKVVPGGQGPGKRDQEALDKDRARLPLTGPRRVVFLGCTSGAGQTLTALMTGQMLAGLRGVPVAAIDLNPGHGSLSRQAQAAPVLTVAAFLAGSSPPEVVKAGARLDVIASDADLASSPVPDERDYARLAELTARHYPVAVVDPGASEVTRVLGIADQLVLVAPASGDAPRSLAMTQEWLGAHGHSDLEARAVTVINGVSNASMTDVEQAEAVARGRCRAIVRIPWDDVLAAGPAGTSSLRPQTRHAYTALAGVLVAGLAAAPVPRKVLH